MSNILHALMSGSMTGWLIGGVTEDGPTIFMHAITQVVEDFVTETKNLLIFSVYAFQLVPREVWQKGLSAMRQVARVEGCESIIAFTVKERVEEIALNFGSSEWTFLRFDVKGD